MIVISPSQLRQQQAYVVMKASIQILKTMTINATEYPHTSASSSADISKTTATL